MLGYLYNVGFFRRNARRKQKRQKGQKRQKFWNFCLFWTFLPFLFPPQFSLFVGIAFPPAVSSQAQSLPDLPQPVFDNFAPEIREQLRKAYETAQASPRDAEAVGRLGMTLHTYEEYA